MWYCVNIDIRIYAKTKVVKIMRVDVAKLRGKIAECGMTQERLARELDMDKSTLSRKMKSNALNFSVGEMHQIAAILNLSKEDAGDIFLS